MRTERIQQALDRAEKKRKELPHIIQVEEHDHDTSVLADYVYTLEKEMQKVIDALKDPVAVHVNMLHGSIARPSVSQIKHIYGDALYE